jgi:predicted ATPase
MITRFEVDGFKSLRNFAVDLEPLTVFVGPNGAGKSNLLESMALLARLMDMTVQNAFKEGRGRILDQFSRFAGEISTTVRFAVELSLPISRADFGDDSLPMQYRYELVIERDVRESGLERLVIVEESLRESSEINDDSKSKIILRSKIADNHNHHHVREVFVIDEHEKDLDEGRIAPSFSFALTHRQYENLPQRYRRIFNQVRAAISKFRLIHLDAARLREPTEKISSGILASDASNLAAVLANLPAPMLGSIRADLISMIPGLAGFDIVSEGDSLRIDFKLSGGEILPARLASDGTLRALALLTVLTAEPHPSVLAIEELENGIYPGRLRRLLSILRDIVVQDGKPQILLTSHSPVVVAAFRDKPQSLRVVDIVVRDGKRDTRIRPVGKPKTPQDAAFVASFKELDSILHAADAEVAE